MNTMRRSIVWAAILVILGKAVLAQMPDVTGHWEGVVTAPLGEIHFAVNLAKDPADGR